VSTRINTLKKCEACAQNIDGGLVLLLNLHNFVSPVSNHLRNYVLQKTRLYEKPKQAPRLSTPSENFVALRKPKAKNVNIVKDPKASSEPSKSSLTISTITLLTNQVACSNQKLVKMVHHTTKITQFLGA